MVLKNFSVKKHTPVEDLKTRLNHGKWSLSSYDGLLTSSKVTVVESKQPAGSESWYGTSGRKAWYWTKFRIVTNLRTNPNLSVPRQTISDALDDQDALNAVFNADLSDLAEIIKTTAVRVKISSVDSTGEESGSCLTNDDGSVGECECIDGFVKDDNDDCIDERSVKPVL